MSDIAIVGMAGRFPGAATVSELWRLLLDGREAVRRFDEAELRAAGIPDAHLSDPAYLPYGTTVAGADEFDAAFFGMSPAEAATTDPQHRMFMECALRALADAGVPSGGQVGVFASTGYPDYLMRNVWPSLRFSGPDLPYTVRIGNQIDFLANRLCHLLDLRGPGVGIQTSCASSLVAVDAACTSLLTGRCDVAVVGAAVLRIPYPSGYMHTDGALMSRDGHCRPFDAAASGFVPGNGCAVLVLKRLRDATADRDRVYASISGVGVNNDGADKTSFTAPSTSGQIGAITQALQRCDVPSTDIGFAEAHGSGTALGDPIEVNALAKAYAAAGGVAQGCGLGSVKANVGHFSSASGVVGLVKAALVLHHQVIPPQINYTTPNPYLALEHSGFTIYDRAHRPEGGIAAAAVSSLGVGGTNAHMVLSAAKPSTKPRPAPAERAYELVLSARTEADLRTMADELDHHLATHEVRIDDLAYTLAHGRSTYRQTAVVRATTIAEARTALRDITPGARGHDIGELPHAVKIPLPGYPLAPARHWIDAPGHEAPPQQAAATGDLLDQVVEIFRTHLGNVHIGPDDEFGTAGGTSLKAIETVDAIIDRLGAALSLTTFMELRTPRRVTEHIRAWPGGNLADPVLVKLRDGTPGEEIFFIYPVNGSVFCYHHLAQHTTFDRTAYAVAYPFDDPNPPRTPAEMAARCIAEIKTVAPTGPYRLSGYSFGGNLAVEIAYQLERGGDVVTDIVMIDPLPLEAYPRPAVELDYIRASSINLAYFLGLPLPTETADTIDGVLDLLRQPTWSPSTEAALRRFAATAVRNAVAFTNSTEPPPVRADLTVLAATQPRNPVYDVVGIVDMPPEVWQQRTTGKLTVIPLPGNHYTLYSDPDNFARLTTVFNRIYGR